MDTEQMQKRDHAAPLFHTVGYESYRAVGKLFRGRNYPLVSYYVV